jgi:membrane fusion protein, copper/silver efflux system
MNRARTAIAAAVVAALVGAAFYAGQQAGPTHSTTPTTAATPAPGGQAERKVLYWRDPMVPGQRFDKPGKSPYMDMPLVPVYADEQAGSGVQVAPGVQQNLGLRTAPVRKAQVASSFDAVGAVQFDERLSVSVQTRVAGYVERLAVRAPMESVRKGQVLAILFAPEWLGPLNELVALERSGAASELVQAARARTQALSIPQELVRQAEETGVAQARFALTAPASGVVAELGVREGVQVAPGMTLFRIAGLEKVWAVAEIPEAQAIWLARGQKVAAALQADPGQTFDGQLKEILPQVSASTRTLQARFEVDNRAGKLMPGMLLRIRVAGPTAERLVVPSEAVIRTGKRAVVIVRKDNGAFEPREVTLGAELGDELEVTQGVKEGEQVVASGQFLVDSEARLRSVLGSMSATATATATPPAPTASGVSAAPAALGPVYIGQGKVESVEPDSITISHGPIPTLKWPAMTMGFGKPEPSAFADVKAGDSVHFEFRKGGPAGYELTTVHRLGSAK